MEYKVGDYIRNKSEPRTRWRVVQCREDSYDLLFLGTSDISKRLDKSIVERLTEIDYCLEIIESPLFKLLKENEE